MTKHLLPSRPGGWQRRLVFLVVAAALFGAGAWLPAGAPASMREFTFHHEEILGTSLDVTVVTKTREDAVLCEGFLLEEIERLRQLLSTYDPASEISRLNATREPHVCSPELIEVLRGYDYWQMQSHGAFNGQLGGLIRLWQTSAKNDHLPDPAAVAAVVEQLKSPAWRIDEGKRTVQRLTDQPLNVNALGRGYILGKAAQYAWRETPNLTGLLVNLGGDMLALGDSLHQAGWPIGVADPRSPEHNARPITTLHLANAAVATSAAYERPLTIQGKRYSHIFDPRTGQPAKRVASATVVATDCATANALATTLCVLTPAEGLKLIDATPGTACLLVTDEGQQLRSAGFAAFEAAPQAGDEKAKEANKWPDGHEVKVTFTLLTQRGVMKYRRPYVAVWIENSDGKAIRTLQVWGNNPRWQKDLYQWWKLHGTRPELVKAVTRATRPAGKYSLVWDGLDDKGKAVEPGTYTIQVEVHREHGKHVRQNGKLECVKDAATVTLARTAETDETIVTFGPKGK